MNEITLDEVQARTPAPLSAGLFTIPTPSGQVFCCKIVDAIDRRTDYRNSLRIQVIRPTAREAFEAALSVAHAFMAAVENT